MKTPKIFYSLEMRFEEWIIHVVNIKGDPGFSDIRFSYQASLKKIDCEGYGKVPILGYGNTIFKSLIDLRKSVPNIIEEDQDTALLVISQALAVLNITSEHTILLDKARLN